MNTDLLKKKLHKDSDGYQDAFDAFEAFKKENGMQGDEHGSSDKSSSDADSGQLDVQELGMVNRFKAQKKHFVWHFVIVILMAVLVIYRASIASYNVSAVNWVCFIFFFVIQYVDHYFSKKKYNHNGALLQTVKIASLVSVVLVMGSFDFEGVMSAVCSLLYVVLVLEYLECVDITSSEIKDRVAVLTSAIYIAGCIVMSLIIGHKVNFVDYAVFIITAGVLVFYLVQQVYNHIDQFVGYIITLNQRNTELTSANSSINDQSRKIKEAVDLLGVQKIELSKAYETISRHSSEMELNNEILNIITEQKDMVKFTKQITETVSYGVDKVKICGLFIDGAMNSPVFPLANVCVPGDKDKDVKEKLISKASDILADIHNFDSVYAVDIGDIPSPYSEVCNAGVKALMRIQIQIEGSMCGGIIIGVDDIKYFDEDTKNFYLNIATQIGIGVNNSNLYATMENLATKDGLTGIYNRRHFNKLFNDYVTDAMDNRYPIAAALFDIDKFKNVNDTYGHSFGDLVIVTVAHIADEVVREHGGILGRYGGEEFIMAFLNMKSDELMPIVTEIHEKIKAVELDHNGETVKVNVSIGVTDYPNICANPAELLNHADSAMYYSKQHGRGRITLDSDEVRKEVIM